MTEAYVLDSYAILALLANEKGSDRVSTILQQAREGKIRALMTWVNVAEVANIVERRWGIGRVSQVLANLDAAKITIIMVDRELALAAAHIKAEHSLAYADAFAAALAEIKSAALVTGDPEFKSLENTLSIEWI